MKFPDLNLKWMHKATLWCRVIPFLIPYVLLKICCVMYLCDNGAERVNRLSLGYSLNFHPLEVVSRYRDPQLQEGENYSFV